MKLRKEAMTALPIKITLYGPNQEADREIVARFVPWGILKKAVALTKELDAANEVEVDAIADLVVQTFHGQLTAEELNAGADLGEMLAVLQSIVARASGMMQANPTNLPTAKKKSK
jgi:hypothetical protein